MKVLLIEDSVQLAQAIKEFFAMNGIDVTIKADGLLGYEEAAKGIYDTIVLDLMLPSMDGTKILANLRAKKIMTPVIILTARTQEDDILKGFSLGADDYLGKPFNMNELLARVKALARRKPMGNTGFFSFGDLRLDVSTREISNGKKEKIGVSPREYDIIKALIEAQGGLVDKEVLEEKVFGYSGPNMYNGVEVYISFLRKKLKALACNVQIKVSRGSGYRLAPLDEEK